MKPELILSLISLSIVVFGLMYNYWGVILKLKDKIAETAKGYTDAVARIEKDFTDQSKLYEARFVALETKMELFWGAVGKVVIDMVKQPIHIEKDGLLDRLKSNDINGEELQKLKFMIEDEVIELKERKDSKAIAYVLILAMIDQKIWEKGCGCKEEKKL